MAAEAIAETTSADTLAVPTDVHDTERVQEMVEITLDRSGDIDVLVNDAGIAMTTPAEEKALSEWQKTIDINLTGAYRCGKYAGQTMIDGDGGLIINISSISAFIANFPQRHVDYQASKAGLEGMKTQLASEWAEYGIRVNNINPGYILTDIIKKQFADDRKGYAGGRDASRRDCSAQGHRATGGVSGL